MDPATMDVYERRAGDYARTRPPRRREWAATLAERALAGRPTIDLGCGPGGYLPYLGAQVIGLDGSTAMLAIARAAAPDVPLVRADLEALPFRRSSLGGGFARNSYVHVAAEALPLALAHLHWAMAVGAPVVISLLKEGGVDRDQDEFPGRYFSEWDPQGVEDVLTGAGFAVDAVEGGEESICAVAHRVRSLPDTVAAGMRVLVCGLNPSEVAADAGYGYAGPTNRFWRAAMAAGLVSAPRDPVRALEVDGVGMTDLVKRATPNAAPLAPAEYVAGVQRVERLAARLHPGVVLFVGLSGWRAAVNKKAMPGTQPERIGGAPAYVMPSTSGVNAHTSAAGLVSHMKQAMAVRP